MGLKWGKKKSSQGWKRAQRELIVAVPDKLSLTSTSTRSICSSSPQRSCSENRRGFGLGWDEVTSGLIQTSNAAAGCRSNESFSTYPSKLSALLFPPAPPPPEQVWPKSLCVEQHFMAPKNLQLLDRGQNERNPSAFWTCRSESLWGWRIAQLRDDLRLFIPNYPSPRWLTAAI